MLKPIGDRILVEKIVDPEPEEAEEKIGVIHIPKTISEGKKGLDRGTVVAVGYGTKNFDGSISPALFKVGQTVCWIKNYTQMQPIEDGDRTLFLMKENEIVGVE